MMDYEGEAPVGGRTYDPHCVDPSEAGALAATLWELPLAAQHYHPHVAQVRTDVCVHESLVHTHLAEEGGRSTTIQVRACACWPSL